MRPRPPPLDDVGLAQAFERSDDSLLRYASEFCHLPLSGPKETVTRVTSRPVSECQANRPVCRSGPPTPRVFEDTDESVRPLLPVRRLVLLLVGLLHSPPVLVVHKAWEQAAQLYCPAQQLEG